MMGKLITLLTLLFLIATIATILAKGHRSCEAPTLRWEQYIPLRAGYCWLSEEIENEESI